MYVANGALQLRDQALRHSGWCLNLVWAPKTGYSLFLHTPQEVDWEVELAVVIGKKGKHIKVRWKGG